MNSNSYIELLKKMECPDSTPASSRVVYDKGLGSTVYSVDHKPYTDLCAGFGTLPLGHNHPSVKKELLKVTQDNHVIQALGDIYPSKSKIEFIETLLSFVPPKFNKAALSLTGAQAIEFAMKTALYATGRNEFIVFDRGYHGLELGALSLTQGAVFREAFETWLHSTKVHVFPYGTVSEELRTCLSSEKIAAVVCEPIQGRGGMREGAENWLHDLYKETQKSGTLLVFDEIFTGAGRTGVSFLASQFECDLLCVGKALGGGMPISACVAPKTIMNVWPESRGEAIHTGTFYGHALSCAIGKATIEEIISGQLIARSNELGALVKAYLAKGLKAKEGIKDVRGRGLMIAIEGHKMGFGVELMNQLIDHSVIAIPCGPGGSSLAVTPALNIKEEELFKALDTIIQTI